MVANKSTVLGGGLLDDCRPLANWWKGPDFWSRATGRATISTSKHKIKKTRIFPAPKHTHTTNSVYPVMPPSDFIQKTLIVSFVCLRKYFAHIYRCEKSSQHYEASRWIALLWRAWKSNSETISTIYTHPLHKSPNVMGYFSNTSNEPVLFLFSSLGWRIPNSITGLSGLWTPD